MTNLRCRSNLPAQTLVFQQVPCLGVTKYGEKGQRNFHAVTWSSISRDAWPASVQENYKCQSKVWFHAVGQEKKGWCIDRKQESISNQKRGPTFRAVDQTQNLCLAGFYTGGSDGPPHDQVRASEAVTKTGG